MQAETSKILLLKFEARITFWVLLKSSMHVHMCGCTHTHTVLWVSCLILSRRKTCASGKAKAFFFFFFFTTIKLKASSLAHIVLT